MYIELVTPNKLVYEGQADVVTLPGSEGSFQVLDNHAPVISSLKKGEIVIKTGKQELYFKVNAGVVEVLQNKITVLTEQAEED
jgi:F-type H+-transporting ATPase subunit epsilon